MATDASPFHGVSAFPITPTDPAGAVDTELLGSLLERIVDAGADSIGLLGSTGIYAYLTREQRSRVLQTARACVAGRIPIIASVGALRTDEAQTLARDAEALGADALLMAPVSYTPLRDDEVYQHYRTVAGSTGLPLCIYNNPSTTHFAFSEDLLARLGAVDRIEAVKLPAPPGSDFAGEMKSLRERTDLAIGYSGDWNAVKALTAGADCWYSVIAGTLPKLGVALGRAARAGNATEMYRIDKACEPLWQTFQAYGSLRVLYVVIEHLGLGEASLPRPLLPLGLPERQRIERALEPIQELAWSF